MSTTFQPETRGATLDIGAVYREISVIAMGPDSPYMRAKDTLLAYFEGIGKDLSAREKADMLVGLVEKTSIGLSTDLMNISVKVAVENRDAPYNLAKVVSDVVGRNIANDKDLQDRKFLIAKTREVTVRTDKSIVEAKIEQATALSKTGYKVLGHGTIPTVTTVVTYSNASDVLDAKLKVLNEYTTMADSYRKNGYGNQMYIDVSASAKKLVVIKGGGVGLDEGLTVAQTSVAIRQEKGFTDNMWQHAANSAANTIGLLLSSGNDSIVNQEIDPTGNPGETLVTSYGKALTKLITAT